VVGMCALQGCSSPSSTQASSGSQPTSSAAGSGSAPASPVGSAPVGSAPASSAPASSASGPTAPTSPTASSPTASHSSAAPKTSSTAGESSSSGTFTVPAASSAVDGWGSYQIINAHRVHVEVCAKKVGNAYAIGVEAIAYNSDYSQQGEIASVILPETPGQQGCSQTYLLFTGHLKVYSFIGQGGTITAKSPLKSIY
jgi:hypothetical protein